MFQLTANELRDILKYNPETGEWIWKYSFNVKIKIGDKAGGKHNKGYWCIGIRGKVYLAHRLAWLYMTGEWPKNEIDHIDLDRGNDKWENLREATSSQNFGNQGIYANNTSGKKGISWSKEFNKWVARIQCNNKRILLGRFNNIDDAAQAYAKAAKELFGEFVRLE